MKKIVSLLVLSMVGFSASAATVGRPAMSGKMIMSAPRYTASVNQLNGMGANIANTNLAVKPTEMEPAVQKDMREAERNACINNNIGVGNTFVWASKYSDTSNYATMVEDVENPENNVCFVRVELKSDDASRVNVADVPAKYFMWGQAIECGSWANESEMEKRILDARKGARIGGIVASSVGGAGLGVGAMELFGNKLINGAVEGQKAKGVNDVDLYRYELLSYQRNNPTEYNRLVSNLRTIKQAKENGTSVADYETLYKPLIDEFVK